MKNPVRRGPAMEDLTFPGRSRGKGRSETVEEAPLTRAWMANWVFRGACLSGDPDALFVQGRAQQEAKRVCAQCPVVAQCLADALDNRTEFGVWGGMTERERRTLLHRRPDVASWADLFAAEHSRRVAV